MRKKPSAARYSEKKHRHHGYNEAVIITTLTLLAFFVLFAFMESSKNQVSTRPYNTNTTGFLVKDLINDGKMTQEEMLEIGSLRCEDIKHMLGTSKDVCVYFKDSNGKIVDIFNDGRFGIGCPGLEIDGQRICTSGK